MVHIAVRKNAPQFRAGPAFLAAIRRTSPRQIDCLRLELSAEDDLNVGIFEQAFLTKLDSDT